MAATKRAGEGAKRGHLPNSAPSSTISSRQGSVDGNMQRCGLCSILSRLVRRAMCVGSSRRGSGESYYQELADTTVSIRQEVTDGVSFVVVVRVCLLFDAYDWRLLTSKEWLNRNRWMCRHSIWSRNEWMNEEHLQILYILFGYLQFQSMVASNESKSLTFVFEKSCQRTPQCCLYIDGNNKNEIKCTWSSGFFSQMPLI